jgi:hypothetical protein
MQVHRTTQTSKPRAIIRTGWDCRISTGKILRDQAEVGLKRNKILTFIATFLVHTKWNKLQFCDQQETQKKQEQRREGGGERTRALSTFRWHIVLGYYDAPPHLTQEQT